MSSDIKNIIITGGSRGLGKALAQVFAQAGHRVFVTGRDRNALESLTAPFSNLHYHCADISRKEEMGWDEVKSYTW